LVRDGLHRVLKTMDGDSWKIPGNLLVRAICNLSAGQVPPIVDPGAADSAVAVVDKRGTQIVHVAPTVVAAGVCRPLRATSVGTYSTLSAGRTAAAGLRASV